MTRIQTFLLVAAAVIAAVIFAWAPWRPQVTAIRYNRLPQPAVTMPGFGREEALGPSQIADLTEYVLALSNRATDNAAVTRAIPLFEQNCAVCHGEAGKGDPVRNTPDLSDDVWINGGTRAEIQAQIWRGDDGRGPIREARHWPGKAGTGG